MMLAIAAKSGIDGVGKEYKRAEKRRSNDVVRALVFERRTSHLAKLPAAREALYAAIFVACVLSLRQERARLTVTVMHRLDATMRHSRLRRNILTCFTRRSLKNNIQRDYMYLTVAPAWGFVDSPAICIARIDSNGIG